MANGRTKWSANVTEHSDALDLTSKTFTSDDPATIARSLKRSAEKSLDASRIPIARRCLC